MSASISSLAGLPTTARAVIYCRVSQDRRRRGRSVAEQEAECRQVCQREGWPVVRVFVDNDVSASRYTRKARPDFAALVRFLDAGGADVLVYWEASRTQRDLRTYVELRDLCRDHGILWNYSGRTYDLRIASDRHATAQDAVSAEHYSDETSERVLRSARANAKAGRPHGKNIYGYARQYDPETRELRGIVEVPAEAEVIREAARRSLSGETLYTIAADLTRRGIPPPGGVRQGRCAVCRQWLHLNHDGVLRRHQHGGIRCPGGGEQPEETRDSGRPWIPTTIRRLLLNAAYIGMRVHQDQVVGEAIWPAILAETDWHTLQARLTDPARRTSPREGAIKHLLSGGIALCGVCEAKVLVQRNRTHLAYLCRAGFHVSRRVGRWQGWGSDRPPQWADRFESIDDLVVSVAVERLSRPDLLDLYAADDADLRTALDEARSLRKRLQEHYDEAATGRLSAAGLAAMEARLLPQIEAADRRAAPRSLPAVVTELAGRPDVPALWLGLTLAQQREIIATLMTIRIMPGRPGARSFDPATVQIEPRR